METLVNIGVLSQLPQAKLANYNAYRTESLHGCLEGTRTAVLSEAEKWMMRVDPGAPSIYWLNGMAGTGKSTIARTVAGWADERGILGGSFFFSGTGDASLRDPTVVFTTIVRQLASFDRSEEFKRRIVDAVTKNPNLLTATDPRVQFTGLIETPLCQASIGRRRIVVIVLDALDECEKQGASEILNALVAAATANSIPFHLKFFITSRPESHITSILTPSQPFSNVQTPPAVPPSQPLKTVVLHDVEHDIVDSDIRLYLEHELDVIWRTSQTTMAPVSLQELDDLVKHSGGSFIFAATCIRVIRGGHPRAQLETLLESSPTLLHVDNLYAQILRTSVPSKETFNRGLEEWYQQFRNAASLVIFLREDLPVDSMDRLAAPGKVHVRTALRDLHSVISISDSHIPRILHPSFPDFICNKKRCGDTELNLGFSIDVPVAHGQIAKWCFQLLESVLKERILGGIDPTKPNSELQPQALERLHLAELYALRHWASHLALSDRKDEGLQEALRGFTTERVLRWLEVMSVLGDLKVALQSLLDARAWAVRMFVTLMRAVS